MASQEPIFPLDSFVTFGDLLKYLRRRARLTQRELSIAVGYSEAQISRLEQNQRPPDLAALTALFIPALYLEEEPLVVNRLMELAAQARGEELPRNGVIAFSRSVKVSETTRTVEEDWNNLPLQLTSFIGREREIIEIKNLLGDPKTRLITLTGSGGCGKTRLALESTTRMAGAYRDGIWFTDLASILDPAGVLHAVTATLGLPEAREEPPLNELIKYLKTKRLLLILDNCEQVIRTAAELAGEILRTCPQVQILATSREILNIPGENRFRVPSLAMPQDETLQTIEQSESARLFIERARMVFPSFQLDADNAASVAQICRRLDGIPLAIELAAANLTLLSVKQIASRLEHSFQILGGGNRTLPRHQTLHAAIEWSYEMLPESERILFHRLSVFVGGWTLEAAESVLSDPSLMPGEDLLGLLSQLVNKSLVVVEWKPRSDKARYILLQTIHEFTRTKLDQSGEMELIRTRHFDHYFRMAKKGEESVFTLESSLDQVEAEIDNLRAALAWTLETNDGKVISDERAGRGLELALCLWLLWWSRGYLMEGTQWLNRLLTAHTTASIARARGLLLAADLAGFRGDSAGKVAFVQESLAIAQTLGDRKRIADALMQMGLIERDLRHYPEAIELLMEARAGFEELKDNLWICRISFLLAETHLLNGNMQETRRFLQPGMVLCRADNDRWQMAWGLEIMGHVERLEGRLEEAEKFFLESLNLRVEVTDKTGIAFALEAFAQLAANQKQYKQAAMLWGAIEGLRKTLNLLVDPLREDLRAGPLEDTREGLEEEVFVEAWTAGRNMKMEQAIEFALERDG